MDSPMTTTSRIRNFVQSMIQRSYLLYLALFTVTGIMAYVLLHYGTDWFKDAETDTIRVWEQAGTAAAVAFIVALVAFFTRSL